MLKKAKINRRNMLASATDLQIIKTEKIETVGSDAENKEMLLCTCKETKDLAVGMTLLAKSNLYQKIGFNTPSMYSLVEPLKIEDIDQPTHTFATLVDKWVSVRITNVYERITNGKTTLHLYFDKSHYLSNGYDGDDADLNNTELFVTFTTEDSEILTLGIDVNRYGEILTGNTLVIDMDEVKADDKLQAFATYLELEREEISNIGQTNELVGVFYNIPKSSFIAKVHNRRYEESISFTLSYERPGAMIDVVIPQTFHLGLTHASDIWNDFTKEKVENCINKPNEMERDVYHPVFRDSRGQFKPIYTINFNLHFREHRGDEWTVNPDTYWNGTIIKKDNKVELLSDEGINYFAYKEPSNQSDLLVYLNFTNNDIKFQKNKLKKSFVRLSFYDSVSPSEQNLLATSTIFMDAGKLFTKYVKNIDRKDAYCEISYPIINEDGENTAYEKTNLTGVRVNREIIDTDDLTVTGIEDSRLSSQFVVKDRNTSQASSEGFYLYLWRDSRTGKAPQDLYLKVEFNHAGYGFTIPFMMPYWDRVKHSNKGGVKTFQEILDDWNDPQRNSTDGPYGIRQYLKFVYIHLKYQYDEEYDRFVYYVDTEDTYKGDETFKLMYDENTGTLSFNLYEAKITS